MRVTLLHLVFGAALVSISIRCGCAQSTNCTNGAVFREQNGTTFDVDNQEAVLTCTPCNTMATPIWCRSGTLIADVTNQTLRVRTGQYGIYECHIGANANCSTPNYLQYIAYGGPSFSDRVPVLSVVRGGDVALICLPELRSARYQATWFIDNNETSVDFGNTRFSTGNAGSSPDITLNGTLRISDTKDSDGGNYICEVKNLYNTSKVASRMFILKIKDPLRPLWPVIGIIIEVILVFGIIGTFQLYQYVKQKKEDREKSYLESLKEEEEPSDHHAYHFHHGSDSTVAANKRHRDSITVQALLTT